MVEGVCMVCIVEYDDGYDVGFDNGMLLDAIMRG